MLSPGGGKGNFAAALAQGKAVMPILHQMLSAVPVDSKEYKAILKMITAGSSIFGAPQEGNLVPAAATQIANAAKTGGAPLAATAPGLKPNVPPAAGAAGAPPMAA